MAIGRRGFLGEGERSSADRGCAGAGFRARSWSGPGQGRLHACGAFGRGGAWTTLDDYTAFLTMIAQDGLYRGRAVLPKAAIAQMATVMTAGLKKGYMPPGAEGKLAEYALAHWCERMAQGRCTFESSPGAFGTYPWIDRAKGLHGIVFLKDRLQRIAGQERALRDGLIQLFG